MKLTNQRPRTDQEDTEAQTADDNKVQTSGEKHHRGKGQGQCGPGGLPGQVRDREASFVRCRGKCEAGEETVIILSQQAIHCSRQD